MIIELYYLPPPKKKSDIDKIIEALENNSSISPKDKADLRHGLYEYKNLVRNFEEGKNLDVVPVQAWQLYTTYVINNGSSSELKPFTPGHMTPIVSHNDNNYLPQVEFLMEFAKVGVGVIEDVNNGSTTTLLKFFQQKHGPDAWAQVGNFKKSQILSLQGAYALEKYLELCERTKELMRL